MLLFNNFEINKFRTMKKTLSLLVAIMLLFTGVNYAQGTSKTATPAPKAKTEKAATTTQKDAKAGPTKKDGTPDKRYKENQKVKKDGTPDMRYKQNKTAAPAAK